MADKPHNSSLVKEAREFAIKAHKSMNHRRKYTHAPYSEHLQNVVNLVTSATDDPDTLAAAWLHDVVEDTPTLLEDVESAFGNSVAYLVDCLTDVSKPSDGNRAVRKEIDRQHLAKSSPQAKTIKLADLIDNCRDICKHNKRFAVVYLQEMSALLEVLSDGAPNLYGLAHKTHVECSTSISKHPACKEMLDDEVYATEERLANQHLMDVFTHAFTAKDLAEPLRSLDMNCSREEAQAIMTRRSLRVVGLREHGEICGYIREADVFSGTGTCQDHVRRFRPGQILENDSSLAEVIEVLTRQEYAFISVFGQVGGFVDRGHLNSPVTRMWLFGIITLFEMRMVRLIEKYFPNESWRSVVPAARLEKAVILQQERSRRHQQSTLVDCLQLSDKGQVILEHPLGLKLLDIRSKAAAKQMIKNIESLRNNLAHGQDIIKYDWASIAGIAGRVEEASYRNRFGAFPWQDREQR
jgi:hypothetical protein